MEITMEETKVDIIIGVGTKAVEIRVVGSILVVVTVVDFTTTEVAGWSWKTTRRTTHIYYT
jgi:hypothetical protein